MTSFSIDKQRDKVNAEWMSRPVDSIKIQPKNQPLALVLISMAQSPIFAFRLKRKLLSGPIFGEAYSSNLRYTEKSEEDKLVSIQAGLGREEAMHAALIPIHKSEDWWKLAQDERRKIFEAQSKHIATGLKYLPAIARRLYHCRDFNEPFDFLTWFEYAPKDSEAFEELVWELRKTEEWKYVDREVDIRLTRTTE
jgi:chlorite dismutase